MYNPDPNHKVIDMIKKIRRAANEEKFPDLLDAIKSIRSVLEAFRYNDFEGVPAAKKFAINSLTIRKKNKEHSYPSFRLSGKWLEERGFHTFDHIHVIALSGLFIICPENFPDDCGEYAISQSGMIFRKQAI